MPISKKELEENLKLIKDYQQERLIVYAKLMINQLINGVQLSDGRYRKYDAIDFYTNVKMSFEAFYEIVKDSLTLSQKKVFRKFQQYNGSTVKLVPHLALQSRRIFDAKLDNSGCYIEGTGREITLEEKEYILEFIKENNLPEYNDVYEAGIYRTKEGYLKAPDNMKRTK